MFAYLGLNNGYMTVYSCQNSVSRSLKINEYKGNIFKKIQVHPGVGRKKHFKQEKKKFLPFFGDHFLLHTIYGKETKSEI